MSESISYVVFNAESGEVIKAGGVSPNMLHLQAGEGEIAVEVPAEVISWPNLNLDPLRVKLRADVDAAAGDFSSQFVTIAPTQDMRYREKLEEALAWKAGDAPADYPFLSCEAQATDQTLDEVAANVVSTWQQWKIIGSRIEGRRMGAKRSIAEATTLKDLVAAATIDWVQAISDPT